MAMDLHINSYGTYLHKVGEMFEVELDGRKQKVSPKKIKSIVVSTSARITTNAIKLAVDNNIDIVLTDDFGTPYGRFWHSKFGSTAYIRRRQIEVFENHEGLELAKLWIKNKVKSSISHLKKLEYKRSSKVEKIDGEISEINKILDKLENLDGDIEEKRNTLMAYEGNASKHYYSVLAYLIPEQFKFNGRSSRPAKDEFNVMLNYCFGILYSKVEKALIVAGLDPFVGILHTDNYNKKSLVFDFIENFRYFAWECVFKCFSRKKVSKKYFDNIYGGLKLNKEGKKFVAMEFLEKLGEHHIYNGRKISNENVIQFEAHKLANSLIKKGEANAGMGDI
ncbi:CRISPR-associated endonuclease Cas1 [uncultured Ilyobacter sp.]|uniref:CRISPR-associated endonuclease Cas1 n=1 Tax=uncultured Ilyobacter sp. TaxID=544433 RepID=UPI002AA85F9D|nr:CRISPR-associated endonuclease Cas1 [uncultured Ilyobacter sp.]